MRSVVHNKNLRVPIRRDEKVLDEFHPLQLRSLLETGYLRSSDECFDIEAQKWIPIEEFIQSGEIPVYEQKVADGSYTPTPEPEDTGRLLAIAWSLAAVSLVLAIAGGLWALKVTYDARTTTEHLAKAEARIAEITQKYNDVLFAASEIAPPDTVRGRIIVRNAAGKRVILPSVKLRLYRQADIEAYLSKRFQELPSAGSLAPTALAAFFLRDLPPAVANTTSNSDGRFEFKIPEPGEYVIQTSIRYAKTGELRLWFVSFDSTDTLNTAVDITESNVVQQVVEYLMITKGR